MTKASPSNIEIVRSFIEAFNAGNLPAMAESLAEDLLADVTQGDGSTRKVNGRDAYMTLIEQLDIPTVQPKLTISQIAEISAEQVMLMIEVRASRKGRKLHNFAAYLVTVKNQKMQQIWMVEALPAQSDAFWSA